MGKKTIDGKRLLDFMVVVECVKALQWELDQTGKLIAIHLERGNENQKTAVHLSRDGLRQLVEPDEWAWVDLSKSYPKYLEYPWLAQVVESEVLFFSLFKDEEKMKISEKES